MANTTAEGSQFGSLHHYLSNGDAYDSKRPHLTTLSLIHWWRRW